MNDAIRKAIRNCNPDQPLEPGDERWVDLDEGRGVSVHRDLVNMLLAEEENFAHIALAGHRGCGKSTELKRVMDTAKSEGFFPLYASVTEAVDPNEVAYSDLLRLMAQLLEREFADDPRMEKAFSNVYEWYREILNIDDSTVNKTMELGGELGVGGEIKGEAEAGVPGIVKGKLQTGLGKILGYIGLKRRSTTEERTEIREKLERYPQTLLDNLNLLLDAGQDALRGGSPKGILFVLDNVDRYDPQMIHQSVIRNATLLNGVAAHLIFTVPISLLYNPIEEQIPDRFRTETLPMVPVFRRQDNQPNAANVQLLVEAVNRRVDRNLFESEDVIQQLVLLSGGCPRDLLRLLHRALLNATDTVTMQHAERAIAVVRDEYARPLKKNQFEILADVHLKKSIDPDEVGKMMLFRRQVLEYNGERWVDAHPLLRETRDFKEALEKQRKVVR